MQRGYKRMWSWGLAGVDVCREATRECEVGGLWELLYAERLQENVELGLAGAAVCREATRECGVGGLWELLYGLVLTAGFGVWEWRQALERRGMQVNLEMTKIMVTGGEMENVMQVGRYSCGVCDRGVEPNTFLSGTCGK